MLTSVRVININVLVHNHSAATKSLQSCLTLCDPIDGSPPGSTVPGILQARVLEWVAIANCLLAALSRQKQKLPMFSL